jgi:hypothetical protein
LSQEFDEWFPGSKFVLTTRKDPQQLVDSEMAMRIGPSHPLFPGLEGNLTLATAIHSYLTIIDPKQSDKVKRTLQQLLVWGLLTRRRCEPLSLAACCPCVVDDGYGDPCGPVARQRQNT